MSEWLGDYNMFAHGEQGLVFCYVLKTPFRNDFACKNVRCSDEHHGQVFFFFINCIRHHKQVYKTIHVARLASQISGFIQPHIKHWCRWIGYANVTLKWMGVWMCVCPMMGQWRCILFLLPVHIMALRSIKMNEVFTILKIQEYIFFHLFLPEKLSSS